MMPHPNRVRPAVVAMTTSRFRSPKPRKKADEAGDLLATLDLGDAAPTEAASVTRTWKFR